MSDSWKNKAGLTANSIASLTEDFKVLEKLNPDVPDRLMRYVLDNEDPSVLVALSNTQDAAETLGLLRGYGGGAKRDGQARAEFYQNLRCADEQLFIRLGKTYAAAGRAPSKVKAQFGASATAIFFPPLGFGDPNLSWLEMLLSQAFGLVTNVWPPRSQTCPALTAQVVERILESEGLAPSLLIRTAFCPDVQHFGAPPLQRVFTAMQGLGESTVKHKATLLGVLNDADFKRRIYALTMMKEWKVPLEPFVDRLVELALGSSKQVREQAEVLLRNTKGAARAALEEKCRTGENEERLNAVRLLWLWEGENARACLEECLAQEKTKKVSQAIRDLLTPQMPSVAKSDDDVLRVEPLPPVEKHAPLGPETEKAWHDCFDKINGQITQIIANKSTPQYHQPPKAITADAITAGFSALINGGGERLIKELHSLNWVKDVTSAISAFLQRPELKPIHLIRFLIVTSNLNLKPDENDRHTFFNFWTNSLTITFRKAHPDVGLRELAAACTACGINADRIGKSLLRGYGAVSLPFGMRKDQVWPYWLEQLGLLEEAFAAPNPGDFMHRYDQRNARTRAFEFLALFPKPPARLETLLWNLALGPKSERAQAQSCLEGATDKYERLIFGLTAGSAETRYASAEWLGRLGDKRSIEPLLAALKKEKNETAKGGMLAALEQLGVPVDQFLDRAGLLKEAEKNIAKGVPEDLKWFPFEQLPVVHWQDTGKQVSPTILRWWLIQGFKLKSPEPGALLRCYCNTIKKPERETLGQFVLDAWIAEDTAPISRDEAETNARNHAKQMVQYQQYFYQHAQKNPQTAATAQPPLTEEQLYASALPDMLKQPKGSAIASKGVLSLAGACAGSGAGPAANRYLKEWYGHRVAHCKALLQMLAWVEHPSATQLLLAVGSRFRTKSIQEEANTQAQALAERKGWTVAELADRTIPCAGLDESGVFTIDYGPRQFSAKLNGDLEFVLTDGDGKVLKALPDPRKDDDETKATEAKKVFAAAKKELKSVVSMQRDRFYEAMCTQRTWTFADWNLYLNQHPIVRHHCQRLVWAVIHDDKAVRLFRPLADGSLTDPADDPVELNGKEMIRVAHECQVTPDDSRKWREHLKDYNVETLFDQFGRQNFNLSEERKTEIEIKDFEGHLLEAFKLRGRATKLGYTRGPAQDGGWFLDYHKRFPTLGIEAVIDFTGNSLPEENRTVALTSLHFERVGDVDLGVAQGTIMLAEVPAVLLSECWNDMRVIAAEGPGFDPDWEKKAQM